MLSIILRWVSTSLPLSFSLWWKSMEEYYIEVIMCVSTAPHSPLLYFPQVWECKCTVPIDLDRLHVALLSPHISPNLPALHPRTPPWCSGRDWKTLIHFWPVNTKLTITGDNWSVWGSVPMVHAHYHNVSDADKKKKKELQVFEDMMFRKTLPIWCQEWSFLSVF